jgi:hypothetical protein
MWTDWHKREKEDLELTDIGEAGLEFSNQNFSSRPDNLAIGRKTRQGRREIHL